MYAASVASPSGGNNEYLIGRQNGLLASVRAGRIIFTFMVSLHRYKKILSPMDESIFDSRGKLCQRTIKPYQLLSLLRLNTSLSVHAYATQPTSYGYLALRCFSSARAC